MGNSVMRGGAGGYVLLAVLAGVVGALSVRVMDRLGVAGPGGGGPVRPFTEVVEKGEPAASRENVVQVVKQVGPAVISIDTLSRGSRGFGFPFSDEVREGQGSGFIVNGSEGLAVTNNHVVEGAQEIQVILQDKRTFSADVVGTDPIGDVALIRLRTKERLPEVKFGDSDKLEIGQLVIAIGNPLGFESSVTVGVLSQVGRQIERQGEGTVRDMPLDDLLQTDAAINPGNSGGPLLDAYGRVVGMNTAIISRAQGIGFAVAANPIKRAVQDLLEKGRVVRPWVGVSMAPLTPDEAQRLGLPDRTFKGVVIEGVRPGEPAAKAGLEASDVITQANGQRVENGEDLRRAIRRLRPGDKLQLKGKRRNKDQSWTVTIGEMPPPDRLQ
jgi:serine protease Do